MKEGVMTQLRFVKLDPAGNTTILVLDPVEKEKRSAIAQQLMKENVLCAEQVAFAETAPPRFCDFSIGMMGGEFCGNATRSAAAWLLFDRSRWQPDECPSTTGVFEIACSGMDRNMTCHVCQGKDNCFDVSAEMPHPLQIEKRPSERGVLCQVLFEGITHHCLFVEKQLEKKEKQYIIHEILGKGSVSSAEAVGILFWDGHILDPWVYVKGTNTLVEESSCGSGTAAVAAAVSFLNGKGQSEISAFQQGGMIKGYCRFCENRIQDLSIGGKVSIAAEGIAYIKDEEEV